ncbi:MAG TPA: ABC-F family ATP-binding cassette domain-containing protein, partial [bacterium]|nr:ABC-F family ATP-binding cassette domain-containing protein [bacterium]
MISLSNVTKQYGPQVLFVDASMQINPGEKIGLVGPNGSGKTTIFRLITGEEEPDSGAVEKPKKLTLGYFRQDVGDMAGRSVLAETIAGAGEVASLGEELHRLEKAMAEGGDQMERALERFGEVQGRFQELGGYDLESRAHTILAGLGLTPDQVEGDVGRLSGGWKMRVALARILLMRPEALLLDEPTNYLDIESILWLEEFLRGYPGAVVMTCHDRDVMNRVVKKIVEIDGAQVRTYSGNYDFYEKARAEEAERREAEWVRQQAMLAKEMRFVERFRAQAAKAAQVQSRLKKLEKIERVAEPKRLVEKNFEFTRPPRSGDDVVKVAAVSKTYGPRVVHDKLDLLVRRGERWAIMGENGSGKTTLLKMMAGVVPPDDGSVSIGPSVVMGYFAQHQMEQLDGERTVFEELENHAPKAGQGVLRNLAAAFGFQGDDIDKPVR